MKLIYKIIHHNYLGLNRTLQIMNGKYYVNWINIVPILYSYENELVFKESNLYKKTNDGLNLLKTYLNNPKEFLILLNINIMDYILVIFIIQLKLNYMMKLNILMVNFSFTK